jgi:hypothetical protein
VCLEREERERWLGGGDGAMLGKGGRAVTARRPCYGLQELLRHDHPSIYQAVIVWGGPMLGGQTFLGSVGPRPQPLPIST